MRAAKVQASLRIRAVSPEPSLLAHTSNESIGTFRQKSRSLASLNGWTCVVEICHDGMLEDTNSLDGAHIYICVHRILPLFQKLFKKNPLWSWLSTVNVHLSPVKRICVFEHSVMTNFNCACPAIQKGQGSGFLSEGSSWLTAYISEQRRFWRDWADAQARLNLRCSHRL